MRPSRLLVGCCLLLVPVTLRAQAAGQPRDTAGRAPATPDTNAAAPRTVLTPDASPLGVRALPQLPRLDFGRPSALVPFGRLGPSQRVTPEELAQTAASTTQQRVLTMVAAQWGQTATQALRQAADTSAVPSQATLAAQAAPPTPASRTSAAASAAQDAAAQAANILGDYADLGLQLQARLEAKAERNRNERCVASQTLNPLANCRGSFQPTFDFQFGVRTGGVVADRVHVNVDYDSQREFDASNNISVYYEGKSDELIQRLEVGNVSFQPAPSRFITGGIPSGNYGLQAIGQLGPMRFRTIVAQQKGNVVKDRVFSVGDRTLQTVENDIDDYKIEPRRFFFTVDPTRFPGYPNIDILDAAQMAQAAASLPANVRPTSVRLYRLRTGELPQNPNGPQFVVRGLGNSNRGQIYDVLREGVDYYIDPSQLWVVLARPLSLTSERLVIAYYVGAGQVDTLTGGTPDLERTDRTQYANLLYDYSIRPSDPNDSLHVFEREIRSVYRVGGEDIQRPSVSMKILAGSTGEQEKAVGFETYLQMFGLSQSTNPTAFDVDNRLWPRPSDPNVNISGGGTNSKIIKDYFLVFPSLTPFARTGLVADGNPANDSIYTTADEDLFSNKRPPTVYRIRMRFAAEGGGEVGTLALGSVQLRQNSERITIDGAPLTRGTDYTVDYELGRVTFSRPDTLFPQPRRVAVQYEENPLFAAAPTSIFGIASMIPFQSGQLNFTAISQSQKTTFNRPPLGFEPASSLVAGVSGNFAFDAAPLTRLLERLPMVGATTLSRVDISGEFATSRPQPNRAGQAYIESFEGEGGTQVSLDLRAWYLGSQPASGTATLAGPGAPYTNGELLSLDRAALLTWQNNVTDLAGKPQYFSLREIDPHTVQAGTGIDTPEQVLWLTLLAPHKLGLYEPPPVNRWRWQRPLGTLPTGQRWRSIRTVLSPTGLDLSRVENLEFWALVKVKPAEIDRNPVLVFDFGTISENSLAFAPDTAYITGLDTTYAGRRPQGLDTLDSERNQLSRSFSVTQDDRGLPGDLINGLVVTDLRGELPSIELHDSVAICHAPTSARWSVAGDPRDNCTVGNNRLDEEDIDLDFHLNLSSANRNGEDIRRFIVRLGGEEGRVRKGTCYRDRETNEEVSCWMHYKIPFGAAHDSVGSPLIRRVQALRLTMISGNVGIGIVDTADAQTTLARLRLSGSPWLKRGDRPVEGIAGDQLGPGTVLAASIGTADQDPESDLHYQSPPGVTDEPDSRTPTFGSGLQLINEKSLRLRVAPQSPGDPALRPGDRAEMYLRFPEGQKSFMGYEELRVWARGRGEGWGQQGELEFFVKIGRDASNFYLYRTPVAAGETQAAWLPEVQVSFEKLYDLRARIQNAYLHNLERVSGCTATDLTLIAKSKLPPEATDTLGPYVACDGGYMAYMIDPNVTAPNLASVQELAVGMVRVDSLALGPEAVPAGDTLELWIDDIRLTSVVNTPGYAGQFALGVQAGDIANFRVNVSRQDPNFRQLGDQPSYVTANAIDFGTSVRLDRLLPQALGIAMPLTVGYTSGSSDPFFLSHSDLRAAGIDDLRTPQSSAQTYSLSLRKVAPMRGSPLAMLVNHLAVNGSYSRARSRSEYSVGRSSSYSVGADYTIAAQGRTRRMPRWLDRALGALPGWLENAEAVRALRGAQLRWNPSQFRVTSAVARTTDSRLSFLKPAIATDDTGRLVNGLTHVWRNTSALELRPFNAIAGRWDFSSLRDLRRYGLANPVSVVATRERDELFGMDLGLERERSMTASLSMQPTVSVWLRPRVELSSQFSMQRDPNARTLLRTDDSTGGFRLPRRLHNNQTFTTGATLDLARAIVVHSGDSSFMRRFSNTFQPVDLTYTRSLSSAFDGSPFDAPVSYQFGLGGIEDFRSLNGRLATTAGLTHALSLNSSFALPFGTTLSNRYSRTNQRNYSRRLDNTQSQVDGENTRFPDLGLSWTFRPPRRLQRIVTSIGARGGYTRTAANTFIPAEAGQQQAAQSATVTRNVPLNVSFAWGFGGGLSTAASLNISESEERRPGGTVSSREGRDMTVDMGKSFKPPASWELRSDIRARIGYQRSMAKNWVYSASSDTRSPLANNGRSALSLNADSDIAENLTFSLQGSRVVSFDNQNNRKFTQTVITAVLQLQFFAGEMH